jgi:hypothetical protein
LSNDFAGPAIYSNNQQCIVSSANSLRLRAVCKSPLSVLKIKHCDLKINPLSAEPLYTDEWMKFQPELDRWNRL